MENSLVLLTKKESFFGLRVEVALAEKGIEYECKEEDIQNKSSLLLQMNPVHKKIPVLIHNGKSICESLIILQYIDELWHDKSPFISSDPYQLAQERFWAQYVDKTLLTAVNIWYKKGEEHELAKKEFMECLKTLEGALGEKTYFGGESFGYVDVALVPLYCWIYALETCGNLSVEAKCPKLIAWFKRCSERDSVSKTLPDSERVYQLVLYVRKLIGVE